MASQSYSPFSPLDGSARRRASTASANTMATTATTTTATATTYNPNDSFSWSSATELMPLYPGQRDGLLPPPPPLYETITPPSATAAPPGQLLLSVPPPFCASVQLQIETLGRGRFTLAMPPAPHPIPVYAVGEDGRSHDKGRPVFASLRRLRTSGSCSLVAGGGSLGGGLVVGEASWEAVPAQTVLSTTTYRFGPLRPPRVELMGPASQPSSSSSSSLSSLPYDAFEVVSTSLLSRAQRFRTRLGTFEWRYAGRSERKRVAAEATATAATADGINNLLVMERVVRVSVAAGAGGSSRTPSVQEVRRPVARLIRNSSLRSHGSSAVSAGNGGRLQIDLGEWLEQCRSETGDGGGEGDGGVDGATDPKGGSAVAVTAAAQLDMDMVVVMAVTTCLCMLKKEVDRRNQQQIMTM